MMQKVILNEIVNYLHKAYPDASIGVGGSVASGTYKADSDIDILFQREDYQKSFLVSFFYKGFKISILGFSKNMLLQKEQKYLYNYNNMPISFISGVFIIYDDKGFITDLQKIVKNLVERRRILRYVLIDELKASIDRQLQIKPVSHINVKKRTYAVIDKIIFIFYLNFHADRIVQKQEGRNPYMVIKRDDNVLYEKLIECMPYKNGAYDQVRDVFENYIQEFY